VTSNYKEKLKRCSLVSTEKRKVRQSTPLCNNPNVNDFTVLLCGTALSNK
jgi:hypothetical protein